MDYTVHGILQARILEWVAVPFSRVSSQPRDQTQVSRMWADSLPAEPQNCSLLSTLVITAQLAGGQPLAWVTRSSSRCCVTLRKLFDLSGSQFLHQGKQVVGGEEELDTLVFNDVHILWTSTWEILAAP